ncbi:MAG: hypothetical protein ACRER2_00360 [Methylococcales bacterium]
MPESEGRRSDDDAVIGMDVAAEPGRFERNRPAAEKGIAYFRPMAEAQNVHTKLLQVVGTLVGKRNRLGVR